jgi:hypothetical protein
MLGTDQESNQKELICRGGLDRCIGLAVFYVPQDNTKCYPQPAVETDGEKFQRNAPVDRPS